MAGNDLNRANPVIDYTSLDAESLTNDLIAYAKATHPDKWTDFNVGQLGRVFLDQHVYFGDLNSFYLNALINEAFLPTALRRQNILDHAKTADYTPDSAQPSTVDIVATLDAGGTYPFTIDKDSDKFSNGGSDEVIFMPVASQTVLAYGSGTVVIPCVEGDKQLNELLGVSDGSANQRFKLARKPMIDGTLEVRVNGIPWTQAAHAVDQAAADLEYLVETNDEDETYVVFGDGVNGAIPPSTQNIRADYKIGGGKRSRLGNSTIETIVSADPTILSVTNPEATLGGGDRPTNDAIRRAAPASLNAHTGAINALDVADVALTTPGVAKAFAKPGNPLLRTHDLYIAPTGGGAPSSLLKVAVQNQLAPTAMLGMLIAVRDPVYKPFVARLTVHLAKGVQQSEILPFIQDYLSNVDETGVMQFPQVNFGGVDSEGEPLINVTRLQREIKALDEQAIQRIEVTRLYVKAGSRSLRTNTGNGTVTVVGDTVNDMRRREYVLRFSNATTFSVLERIIGRVQEAQNDGIVDDSQDFEEEAPGGLVGAGFTILNPNRLQTTLFTVSSNDSTQVTTTVGGVLSLAARGSEYYIQRTLYTGLVLGANTITDGLGQTLVSFTVTAGTSPFVFGDEIIIDTYPPVGDLILRSDEIPTLDAGTDLEIRLAGGLKQ